MAKGRRRCETTVVNAKALTSAATIRTGLSADLRRRSIRMINFPREILWSGVNYD